MKKPKTKTKYIRIKFFLMFMEVLKEFRNRNYKVALLVDADNVKPHMVSFALNQMSNEYGNVVIRRIYANWSNPFMNELWNDYVKKNNFVKRINYSSTKGKNSTDISMVIDSMDIVYTRDIDVFCIVSSDSDFINLAYRLREENKFVVGIGSNPTQQTQSSYDKYYTDFDYETKETKTNDQISDDMRKLVIKEKFYNDVLTSYRIVSSQPPKIVKGTELYNQYQKVNNSISFIHYNNFLKELKTIENISVSAEGVITIINPT